MENLDAKNRKILYELDLDSRQSFSQLGKKVGLHKDNVAERVKNLLEKGIIKNFFAEVNAYKLGYNETRFYFTYQNATPEKKQEIIDYLVNNPYTDIVHSIAGQYDYDLCVISQVRNYAEFYKVWNSLITRYKEYFSKQIFSVTSAGIRSKYHFLLDEKPEKDDKIIFATNADVHKEDIDDLDKKILDLLLINSRIPTLEMAQKLNTTVTSINSRMNKLLKTGVIIRYTINIDFTKIGYQWYKANIVLRDPNKIHKITEYIQNNPHTLFQIISLGYVDLEFAFLLNNASQLHQIMEDVSSQFPDAIRNYTYFSVVKTHKFGGMDFWNK